MTTPPRSYRRRRDNADRFEHANRELARLFPTPTEEEVVIGSDAEGNTITTRRFLSASERIDHFEAEEDAWLREHGIDPAEFRHWCAMQLLTFAKRP
jgi:hypothetical protein